MVFLQRSHSPFINKNSLKKNEVHVHDIKQCCNNPEIKHGNQKHCIINNNAVIKGRINKHYMQEQ